LTTKLFLNHQKRPAQVFKVGKNKMTTAQILELGTLNKAYNTLLPIVQKMQFIDYNKSKEDEKLEFIFNAISISKTSPKFLRGTLEDAINLAKRTAFNKNIIIE
jgi:hypothetical protein